jgi:hypothetical protein
MQPAALHCGRGGGGRGGGPRWGPCTGRIQLRTHSSQAPGYINPFVSLVYKVRKNGFQAFGLFQISNLSRSTPRPAALTGGVRPRRAATDEVGLVHVEVSRDP